MRASSRVRARSTSSRRSRSASAAVGVQTPVRAMACRSRAEEETPAAAAFARHEASSRGDTRACTRLRRSGDVRSPESGTSRSSGSSGVEGA